VRDATAARLEIGDGQSPRSIVPLEAAQLTSGVFTYQRHNERVDVTMVLDQPDGAKVRQATSFLGLKPPEPEPPSLPAAPAPNPRLGRERDEALKTVASLRAQLAAEDERARRIEKDLAAARAQVGAEGERSRRIEKDLAAARAQVGAEGERSRQIEKELAAARAQVAAERDRGHPPDKDLAAARAQLAAEREHSRQIEKELAAARAQLHEQQLRRLSRQALPPGQ
jgi:hypothetical protein